MEGVAITGPTLQRGYLVRKMDLRDLAEVLEIQRMSPEAAQWNHEAYEHACAGDFDAWIIQAPVGIPDGERPRVCGFLVSRTVSGEMEILNLAVSQHERRRTVASGLLAAALEHGRSTGAKLVFVETRESNAAAIHFYRSHGFNPAQRRRAYYAQPLEDALVFSRLIE